MAAVGTRFDTTNVFYVDANGVPGAGYRLFFYATGTSTPQATYDDVTLLNPNTNPVVADANGYFGNIFLIPSNAYRVDLYNAATADDPTGVQIWSLDPVGPAAGGAASNAVGIIGEVRDFAGPAGNVPSQWYLCYGQAVSRTTFVSLFNVIGTTWGIGDGTTTFNLPDLRGRVTIGKDDMGGSAANRVTNGVSGITGNTLGAVGGDQSSQVHGHGVNDPTHTHTLTDPGHAHAERIGQGGSGAADSWTITGTAAEVNLGINTGSNTTGITITAAATGVTLDNYGVGTSQNMPPGGVVQKIIYAGA